MFVKCIEQQLVNEDVVWEWQHSHEWQAYAKADRQAIEVCAAGGAFRS